MEYIRLFVECNIVMFLSLAIMYSIQRGIEKLIKIVVEGIKESRRRS